MKVLPPGQTLSEQRAKFACIDTEAEVLRNHRVLLGNRVDEIEKIR